MFKNYNSEFSLFWNVYNREKSHALTQVSEFIMHSEKLSLSDFYNLIKILKCDLCVKMYHKSL